MGPATPAISAVHAVTKVIVRASIAPHSLYRDVRAPMWSSGWLKPRDYGVSEDCKFIGIEDWARQPISTAAPTISQPWTDCSTVAVNPYRSLNTIVFPDSWKSAPVVFEGIRM